MGPPDKFRRRAHHPSESCRDPGLLITNPLAGRRGRAPDRSRPGDWAPAATYVFTRGPSDEQTVSLSALGFMGQHSPTTLRQRGGRAENLLDLKAEKVIAWVISSTRRRGDYCLSQLTQIFIGRELKELIKRFRQIAQEKAAQYVLRRFVEIDQRPPEC